MRNILWIMASAITLIAFTTTIYASGYFLLGERGETFGCGFSVGHSHRTFPYRWHKFIYEPAGRVEEAMTGETIRIRCDEPELVAPNFVEAVPEFATDPDALDEFSLETE